MHPNHRKPHMGKQTLSAPPQAAPEAPSSHHITKLISRIAPQMLRVSFGLLQEEGTQRDSGTFKKAHI